MRVPQVKRTSTTSNNRSWTFANKESRSKYTSCFFQSLSSCYACDSVLEKTWHFQEETSAQKNITTWVESVVDSWECIACLVDHDLHESKAPLIDFVFFPFDRHSSYKLLMHTKNERQSVMSLLLLLNKQSSIQSCFIINPVLLCDLSSYF